MADEFHFVMETEDLVAALARVPDLIAPLLLAVCGETAARIVTTAQSRVERATGETAEYIHAELVGGAYLVKSTNPRMPNLPLWIEKGTKRGKPGSHTEPAHPYFYVAAQLEAGAHEQRMRDAVQQGADQSGLGGA